MCIRDRNNCFPTILFIELVCFLQITLFEYPGVGVIKQLSAEEMSYHVIAGIA